MFIPFCYSLLFRMASTILSNLMLEQRHKAAMKELEKEMQVEMAKQREELNRELEDELKIELEVCSSIDDFQ